MGILLSISNINSIKLFDAMGERQIWAVDRKNGIIKYWPKVSVIATVHIKLPRLNFMAFNAARQQYRII